MAKKGGYQMVNLATLTYALALAYLNCGKPLLIYDGTNKPYFADSIEKVGDNIVIRKSGQTIVVDESDNVVNGIVASDVTTKKIYWHGLDIFVSGTTSIQAHILNTSDTSFSLSTLDKWFKDFGTRVVLSCNGVLTLEGTTYNIYMIVYSSGAYNAYYKTSSGYSSVLLGATLPSAWSVTDNINAVN